MTLTIFITFRSPRKKFVKWLLDVGAENIEHSTYYERKTWVIVLKGLFISLLFTWRLKNREYIREHIREYIGIDVYTTIHVFMFGCSFLRIELALILQRELWNCRLGYLVLYRLSILLRKSNFHFRRFAPSYNAEISLIFPISLDLVISRLATRKTTLRKSFLY